MATHLGDWIHIAAFLHQELRKIDPVLARANVPISARKWKAFKVLCVTALEFSDPEAFHRSVARGAFQVIINDWYLDRYGDNAGDDETAVFVSMVLVHETPFIMRVPKGFNIPGDEPNTEWVGWPASVQAEENPLNWIQNRGIIDGFSSQEIVDFKRTVLDTANLVRSIGFDVRSLLDEDNSSITKLAGSVSTDLQSSARNLCERNEASLRSAAWNASQATEKALKLFIRRKRQTARPNHNFTELADKAENLGAQTIDRAKLALIPGKDAPKIRYEGDMTVSRAAAAYRAALSIIKQVIFQAKPDSHYNLREARIKLKQPPWFDFDINAFRKELRLKRS